MASSDTPKTILLGGDPIAYERVSASGSAITPGQLLEVTSAGEVQEHSTVGGNAQPAFARAEEYAGGSIDDAYAVGDTVPYYVGRTGDRFYAFLKDGEDVGIGTILESAGNGELQEHTPQAVDEGGAATYTIYGNAARFMALEAKAPSGSNARIKIEVL